jgi:hypothetical protein
MTDEEKKAAADLAAKEAADKEAADKEAAEAAAIAAAAAADGKPTDKEAALLKEVMKWKAKAGETETAKTAAEVAAAAALKLYEGIDPEVARKAIAAAKAAEVTELESKGEYTRILTQVNADHAKALETINSEKGVQDATIASLNDQINTLTIGNSFGNSAFVADKLVLSPAKAEVLYSAHFDVEGGKVIAYDKPRGAAERTPMVGAGGVPMTFEAAIEKIVSADLDFEKLKKSTLKPGAGSDEEKQKAIEAAKETGLSGMDRIRAALNTTK